MPINITRLASISGLPTQLSLYVILSATMHLSVNIFYKCLTIMLMTPVCPIFVDGRGKPNLLDMGSLLIKPVQRVMKYPLLLGELWQATPDDHPDNLPMKEALTAAKIINLNINEFKRRKDIGEALHPVASQARLRPQSEPVMQAFLVFHSHVSLRSAVYPSRLHEVLRSGILLMYIYSTLQSQSEQFSFSSRLLPPVCFVPDGLRWLFMPGLCTYISESCCVVYIRVTLWLTWCSNYTIHKSKIYHLYLFLHAFTVK